MSATTARPRAEDAVLGVGLLAATANVVMQLARPEVGHGVAESTVASGQLFRHPVKRTRTTLTYLAVALLGTEAERRDLGRAVDAVHAHVRSGPRAPVAYDALDPELQLWVAACLYRGLEDTYATFLAPLDADAADALYSGSARLGTTLQVPPERWPADRTAFQRYWEQGLERVRVDATVRAYLDDLLALRFLPRPLAAALAPAHRFVTTGFLDPPFREQLGLGFTARQQRRFDRCTRALGAVTRRLPRPLRRLPFNLVLADLRRRRRRSRPLV